MNDETTAEELEQLEDTDEMPLADDLVEGAGAIAKELFGGRKDRQKKNRRRVYWLIAHNHLPAFHIGKKIFVRRSTLRQWIADQEKAARS